MRVWLDDERPMPAGYDVHVKTAPAAIALIDGGNVSEISLDNYLGTGLSMGLDVAEHIEKVAAEGKVGRIRCRIHTSDPEARDEMKAMIRNAYRSWMEAALVDR